MRHRYAVLINVIFCHMPASCDFHATLLKMNIYQLDKLTYFAEYVSGHGQTILTPCFLLKTDKSQALFNNQLFTTRSNRS